MKPRFAMSAGIRFAGSVLIGSGLVLIVMVPHQALAQTKWVDGLLTDDSGVPIYTSKREAPGTSECYGQCLSFYLPYLDAADAKPSGDLSLITRKDGNLQWAYKGKALYRWWNDKKPMAADGHVGNWYLVRQ